MLKKSPPNKARSEIISHEKKSEKSELMSSMAARTPNKASKQGAPMAKAKGKRK